MNLNSFMDVNMDDKIETISLSFKKVLRTKNFFRDLHFGFTKFSIISWIYKLNVYTGSIKLNVILQYSSYMF